MKIKYTGPRDSINVGGFGAHNKEQVKDYPDDVAEDLLDTSKKQQFEAVDTPVQVEQKTDADGEKKPKKKKS